VKNFIILILLSDIFVKPGIPGFLLAHKPGFTGLKIGGFTRVFGYPGTRVAFSSSDTGRRSPSQLTKHKRFRRSFELSKGDVRLPKLFRQTVPQRWPDGDKTAVIELVV